MSIKDILTGGGGAVLILMTLIQIAPVKVNPWSWVAKLSRKAAAAFGKAVNENVMKELDEVKKTQAEHGKRLEEHIKIDGERYADQRRTRILRFNNELLRSIEHTKEEFIEVLADIDCYEKYCEAHDDYQNNRAVLAIQNIKQTYMVRLKKRDFLSDGVAANE